MRPSHGRGRFSPIPDESTRSRELVSTILTDLRAINVFEIAELSLQVVPAAGNENSVVCYLHTLLLKLDRSEEIGFVS